MHLQVQAHGDPNLMVGWGCLPGGMCCTRGWFVTLRPLLAAAVTPGDVQRGRARLTNVPAQAAGMVKTSTPRAWGATPALLTAPPLLPRPSLGTCWLLLHSPEEAAIRAGLGVSLSEHQWWEGDTMLVPEM